MHKHKLAIFAWSRAHDKSAATLMRMLRTKFDNNIEFVGIGGSNMLSEGLNESMFEIDKVWDKPVGIWRGVPQISRDYAVISGYNKHKMMANTIREMKYTRVFEKTVAHNPSAVLAFGEFKFTFALFNGLFRLQRHTLSNQPMRLHVSRFGCPPDQPEGYDFEPHRDMLIDHTYFSIPFEEPSWDDTKQSKMHIGDYGTYKALDFLVSRSEYYINLRRGDKSIIFNRQFTKNILRDLKKEENLRFRKKCNIDERDLVLFLGSGNRLWENHHMMQSLEAIEKFVYWVKARRRNVVLVLPFESSFSEAAVSDLAKKLNIRIICPYDEETKYSSMAASNLGLCYNGGMVNELGINLVPTIVSQDLDHFEHYGVLRKSRLISDVNISLNGPVMPELLSGEWNTEYIYDHLTEMYETYFDNNFGLIDNDTWATSTTRSVIRLMNWREFDEENMDNIPYGWDEYRNPNHLVSDHVESVIRNHTFEKDGVHKESYSPISKQYRYKTNLQNL